MHGTHWMPKSMSAHWVRIAVFICVWLWCCYCLLCRSFSCSVGSCDNGPASMCTIFTPLCERWLASNCLLHTCVSSTTVVCKPAFQRINWFYPFVWNPVQKWHSWSVWWKSTIRSRNLASESLLVDSLDSEKWRKVDLLESTNLVTGRVKLLACARCSLSLLYRYFEDMNQIPGEYSCRSQVCCCLLLVFRSPTMGRLRSHFW